MFTDGSLLGGACGYGVYITDKGKDEEFASPMPEYSSVFQCEVMAVKAAAEMLENERGKTIQLYIDSQAAIMALCSNEIKSKTVLSTIKALETIGDVNEVILNWIKAHNGHAMNDIADQLARTGSEAAGPHLQIPIPDAHVKDLIDKETLKRWNLGWIHLEGHRQTKLFFPEVNCNKAKQLYKYSKAKYSQAIRWITGFNGLAYQNNEIDPIQFPNPNCQLCEQLIEETSAHLINECPALLWERMDAFKVTHDLNETDLKAVKIPQLIKFLSNRKVMMMENISEYPLLFIEDYENDINHIQIDNITNHETSLSSRNSIDDDTVDGGSRDASSPPLKRRDRRASTDRTGVGQRQGIG